MSHRIRLVFVAALLLSFYAVMAVAVLSWLALVVLIFYSAGFDGATTFPVPSFLFCAGTAVLVYALVDATCRSLFLVGGEGTWLSPREAPELDHIVKEVANEFRISEPLHLRLTSSMSAELVDEDNRFLGLVAGNRVLSIGAPLLAVLSTDQVRAVVAHELAHLSLRHDRVRAFTARLEVSLTVARESLVRFGRANGLVARYTGLPQLLIGAYIRLFRWLVQPIRRRQEFEADQAAASICTAPLLAEALCQRALAETLWAQFQQVFLEAPPGGVLPADPFRGFAHAAADPEIQHRIPSLRDDAITAPAMRTEFGSWHPDLMHRLRDLGGAPAALLPVRPGATAAPHLSHSDIARLLPAYQGATTLPWKPWLRRWIDQRSAHLVTPLLEAVREVSRTATPITLHQVLHLVAAGDRMPLARALTAYLPEPQVGAEPLDLLGEALLALVRRQLGERPRSPSLREMVMEAVVQPSQSSRLTLYLADVGVDPMRPVEGFHGPTGPGQQETTESGPGFKTLKVAPELPEAVQELVPWVRNVTLTVLVVASTVGGFIWMGRDDVTYEAPSGQVVWPRPSTAPFAPAPPLGQATAMPSWFREPLHDPLAPRRDYSIPLPVLPSSRPFADLTP
ncbi:M48 family metallopeptidase [Streptomyces sp. NBC_00690]|uniref:M48 family metallopeptidase n=1 Tax=Streptomyces sp. NBC_00690 TaxID=2975808 RepID=UPI002E2D0C67|nr:M48 family metallopeptidase [Streptomyces sp. NBC_00690]